MQLESIHCCFEFTFKQQKLWRTVQKEGVREEGWKKCFAKCQQQRIFYLFILLLSLSLAGAGVGAYTHSL